MKVKAPAKINIYLEVTGRRDDGYHVLDSLVVFADEICDVVTIEAAPAFGFTVTGPYAPDLAAFPVEDNLVIKAARALGQFCDRPLDCLITLEKNLPIAAGIGGGSADAAAVIKGLLKFWDIAPPEGLHDLLLGLGADVPVCYVGKPVYMRGIGEDITPINEFPKLYTVLAHPNQPCSTAAIFKALQPPYSEKQDAPDGFADLGAFLRYAHLRRNDLYEPAHLNVPVIDDALHALAGSEGCLLTRMSGSGATCFGLFETKDSARLAADNITRGYPGWWVQESVISAVFPDTTKS